MGIVSVDVEVSGESGTRATTSFLVDSGASYSVLPHAVWKRLGLRPKRAMRFELADGTEILAGSSRSADSRSRASMP